MSRSDKQISGKGQGRGKVVIVLQTDVLSMLATDYLCVTKGYLAWDTSMGAKRVPCQAVALLGRSYNFVKTKTSRTKVCGGVYC